MELLRTMGLIGLLFGSMFLVTRFVDWQAEKAKAQFDAGRVPPRTYCTYNWDPEYQRARRSNDQHASVP